MEIIERVRSLSKLLGGRRDSLVARLIILLNLVIQADQLFSMYIDWNVFVKRLFAFKEFNSALFAILVCLSVDDIPSLCNMTEKLLNNDKIVQKDYENSNITSKLARNATGPHQKLNITSKSSNSMKDSRHNSKMITESLTDNMLYSPQNPTYTKFMTDFSLDSDKTPKYTTNLLMTDQKTTIISKCMKDMTEIEGRLKRILVTLISFASGLPIILACLITIFKDHSKIDIDRMPFIVHFYYPEGYKTLKVYFVSLFLGLVWYAAMLSYIYCASVAFALASISLYTRMRLICQSLFEVGNHSVNETADCNDIIAISQLKQIIREHQEVFNDFLELNRRSKIILSAFINILAIQMCCYIFFIIELDNVSAKIKYIVIMFMVFSLMSFFCTFGQRLTDEVNQFSTIN